MEAGHELALAIGKFVDDPTSYGKLEGSLIYLTITQSKLSFSIHILSQFMEHPKEHHMAIAKCVFTLFKSQSRAGSLMVCDFDLQFVSYCDADWEHAPSPDGL